MKHEEFLKQVKERASIGNQFIMCSTPKEVLKLLAIIEKLREQRDSWILSRDAEWTALTSSLREQANKELDKIVEEQ